MTRSQLANVAIIIDIAMEGTPQRNARGVFRTQSNIYDGAFLAKIVNGFHAVLTKK